MGLLDNVLGTSFDDPRTAATLQLAQGLLSSPRALQGLSGGLLGYQQSMQEAKRQKAAEEMRAMQMQQQRMAMEQMQAEQAKRQAIDQAYRGAMRSPQQMAMAANGGPTNAAAQALPNTAPGIDQAALIQGLMQADPQAAYQMLQPKPADYKVVGNALLQVGPNGVKEAYRAPEKTDLPSAVREYEYAKGQGYQGSFQQFQIEQRRAGASNTTVSLGSPVPVTLPDGSTALVQPSNRPGAPPQIMTVPGGTQPLRPQASEKSRDAMRENSAAIDKIDRAIAAIDRYPGALGGKNYLDVGGAVMQRVDPEGIEARALLADVGSAKIHDRSGAAVSAAEFPRLQPFVPLPTDTPETAKKKLALFRREVQFIQQELGAGAPQQAAKPAASSAGVKFLGFEGQ